MWWTREESPSFYITTKYDTSWNASAARGKAKNIGELTETPPFDPAHPRGQIVLYTRNSAETLAPITKTYAPKETGPYIVLLSLDGQTYSEHPESYATLARASLIVKKYLRKHYRKVVVVKC